MGIVGAIDKVPVPVATGVREAGHRTVLALSFGDKESASDWHAFFKNPKRRDLNAKGFTLGIMDRLRGLDRVFKEESPKTEVQRCQPRVASSIPAKVPRKLKKTIGNEMRSIFYAFTREKALEFFLSFKIKWKPELPSTWQFLYKINRLFHNMSEHPEDAFNAVNVLSLLAL